MSFWEFLQKRGDDMIMLGIQHLVVVSVALAISTVISLAIGIATYRTEWARETALAVSGALFTIPTFALLVLFIAPVGLGFKNVVATLTVYGLMPIIRNTIAGLRQVEPAVIEAALGMGMSRRQTLFRIELPLAWPVIITGVRMTALLMVAGAAIGAIVLGPGYGEFIFTGLYRVGTDVALNLVLAGILGVVIVAILFDTAFSVLRRLTTSKGIR